MTYPPTLPSGPRSDPTVAAAAHPDDHNKIRTALASLIEVLGADPAGPYADLTTRMATLLDEAAVIEQFATPDSDVVAALDAAMAGLLDQVTSDLGARFADYITGGAQRRSRVEVWPGTEPTPVMVVDSEAAQYGLTWTANPTIAVWRGLVYLMFDGNASGGTVEGAAGQRVFVMTTTDGVTFTAPHEAFTSATYANNPTPTAGRVHFQPNLFVVADELWSAWYDGTAGYISKLTAPGGKWTNYRIEFDAAGSIHLNAADVATAPPVGRSASYTLAGVAYLPFPSQQPTPLEDGTHAIPFTFQSSVSDPNAVVGTPVGFWDSLKFNAVVYVSADGTELVQSAPVPSSLVSPYAPPSSAWEPFIVESRTGDLYCFSRNNKLAVADAETFLVSRSRDRMTWEPVQASGLELAVTRGMALRYGRSRWVMVHTDLPQQDTGTPTLFTVANRLNPTAFVSRTGRDDFISGPPFGQVASAAPLSYPALCIGPDGKLWTLFTRDDTTVGDHRRTYLSKIDLPQDEDVAYAYPGRRPLFLTLAGPTVAAAPARLIFDGNAVATSATVFDPAGDSAFGVWHKPDTSAVSGALVDYRHFDTGGGFLLRPGGPSIGAINLDHGQAITAGAWQFIGWRITVATGLVRVYTAALADTAFTTRDFYVHAVTASGNPADGDTVTIAGIVYTFRTTPSLTRDVLRGATLGVSLNNLAAKIAAVDSATLTATSAVGALSGNVLYVTRVDRADFALSATGAVLGTPATLPIEDGQTVNVGRKSVASSTVPGYAGQVADVQIFDGAFTDAKMADVHNQSAAALGAGTIAGATAAGAPTKRLTSTSLPADWPTIDDVHPYVEETEDGTYPALGIHGEGYAALELPYLRNHVELGFRLPVAPTGTDKYVIASIGSNANPVRLYVAGDAPTLLKLNGTTVATIDPTKRTLVAFDVADGNVTMGTTVVRANVADRVYLGNAFPQALLDSGKITFIHLDACRVSELRPSSSRAADNVLRSELGVASGVATLGADGILTAGQRAQAVSCILTSSVTQSIVVGDGVKTLVWDGEESDPEGWHDPSTNPGRVTVTRAGTYTAGAMLEMNVLADGSWVILRLYKNGGIVAGRCRVIGGTGNGGVTIQLPSRPIVLAAGDYLEFRLETNDAASRNVRESVNGTVAWVTRVGGA